MRTTELQFLGQWNLWAGLAIALVLAAAAWMLYRRETARRGGASSWALPALRAAIVFLLVMMLTGPVLSHSELITRFARLVVLIDGSQSMEMADVAMEPGRKFLGAQRLGLLPPEPALERLNEAAEALAGIAVVDPGEEVEEPGLDDLRRELENVRTLLQQAADIAGDESSETLQKLPEVFAADVLSAVPSRQPRDDRPEDPEVKLDPRELKGKMTRFAERIRQARLEHAAHLAAAEDGVTRDALQKWDEMSRWQRVEAQLLQGENPLLPELARDFELELIMARGPELVRLWQPSAPGDTALPSSLPLEEAATATDLSHPLLEAAGADEREMAILLFSDGRHNTGRSPSEVAPVLGERSIPVFAIATGSGTPPPDLALLEIGAPGTVFFKDTLTGQITITDHMPKGQPFRVQIQREGKTLWEEELTTEGTGVRQIPYEIEVEPLVEEMRQAAAGPDAQANETEIRNLPLQLDVVITPLEEEVQEANNSGQLITQVITQPLRLLLIDGRPRWEFRFIRNTFERDEQWEVNPLLVSPEEDWKGWTRGREIGTFPEDRETLLSYDVVVMGDVQRQHFSEQELEWLRDFVDKRGGGLLLIDGQRQALQEFQEGSLAPVLPVEWLAGEPVRMTDHLQLTPDGAALSPLVIGASRLENETLWRELRAPHWVASVKPLPDTETLVEAVTEKETTPALVLRRFGAGKVLYAAFDESYRLRYEVADQYHQRYWHQLAGWIMETPFSASDERLSVGVDAARYAVGETAGIRARLRDAQGRIINEGQVRAELFREGERVGVVDLVADEGGVFRGRTAGLDEMGEYEVRIVSEGNVENPALVTASFNVTDDAALAELAYLSVDEELMRGMAAGSGGEFLYEEDTLRLQAHLEPFRTGEIRHTETVLWQSWWWFLPLVLLFGTEWIVRKRSGMI